MTTEKVPLDWTCGEARVINVRKLVGSTTKKSWPASPEITVEHIKEFEAKQGALVKGDVVIFETGHVDKYFKPEPADTALWGDQL